MSSLQRRDGSTLVTTVGGATAAWVVGWVESERGWGQRPDGFWYYPDIDTAKAETNRMLQNLRSLEAEEHKTGRTPDVYSFPNDPVFVLVSDDLAKEIAEKGCTFRGSREH